MTKLKKIRLFLVAFTILAMLGFVFATNPFYVKASETLTESEFSIEGAYVRRSDPMGIRFTTNIDKDKLASLESSYTVSVGTVIIPTDDLTGELTVDTVGADVVNSEIISNNTETYFNTVLYNIPVWGYGVDLTARSFVKLTNNDTVDYIYTTPIQRSIKGVAEGLISSVSDPTDIAVLQDIIDSSVNYDFSDEKFLSSVASVDGGQAIIENDVLVINGGASIYFSGLSVEDIAGLDISILAESGAEIYINGNSDETYTVESLNEYQTLNISSLLDSESMLKAITIVGNVSLKNVVVGKYSTINLNGGYEGAEAIDSIKYSKNTSEITLPSLSRDGYNFDGWYDDTTLVDDTYISNLPSNPVDVNLIAKWSEITYPITLKFNNGASDVEQTVAYGSSLSAITGWVESPTLEGETFVGWYLNGKKVTGEYSLVNLDTENANVISAKYRASNIFLDAEVESVEQYGATVQYWVDPINRIENNNEANLSIYNYSNGSIATLENGGNSALKIVAPATDTASLDFTFNNNTTAGSYVTFDLYFAVEDTIPSVLPEITYGVVYGGAYNYNVGVVTAEAKYNEWFKVVVYIADDGANITASRASLKFYYNDIGVGSNSISIYIDNVVNVSAYDSIDFESDDMGKLVASAIAKVNDVAIIGDGSNSYAQFTYRGIQSQVKIISALFNMGDTIQFDLYIDTTALSTENQTIAHTVDPEIYSMIYKSNNSGIMSLFHNGAAYPTLTTLTGIEDVAGLYNTWITVKLNVGNGAGYTGSAGKYVMSFDHCSSPSAPNLNDFSGNIIIKIDNFKIV